MLRRGTPAAPLQLSLLTATAATPLSTPHRTFFDKLKKQLGAATGNSSSSSTNNSNASGSSSTSPGDSSASQGMPGFPPGLNAQQLQTMQQLFASQPKEKQEQLMKQAMEMQKMMGKIPGFGKFAQKNAAMMEQMLKMQGGGDAAAAPPPTGGAGGTSSASSSSPPQVPQRRDLFSGAAAGNAGSSAASRTPSGPSLDDLRKVNLGPEIEALFQELRTIRNRKNEYRDKYHAAQSALDALRKEHNDLVAREASVRGKLAKAEQDVMLLTSENMELRESSKTVKQVTQANRRLKSEVEQLKAATQASAAPGTASYTALQQQHQAAEDAMRSLQRKVDRMRRRDPLLQFSLACSDVARLCAPVRAEDGANAAAVSAAATGSAAVGSGVDVVSEAAQEAADRAFAALESAYRTRQQAAWEAAAHDDGAAAKAYVAVVRRYVMTRVPHSNYDAVVSYTGNLAAVRAAFGELGFNVEEVPGESARVHVVAAADAAPFAEAPGPFGYAVAWRLAASASAPADGFTVTGAHPFVSATLVDNSKRSTVQYETARASGPGGQATNVTETQVYAKLSIDGVFAVTAEAQDSRSALSNKEAALAKLRQQRRQHLNDMLAKQERAESVQAQLVSAMAQQRGFVVEEKAATVVAEAAAAKVIAAGDAALVAMLTEVSRSAAAAAAEA